jgi:murein DD-endopeptidase
MKARIPHIASSAMAEETPEIHAVTHRQALGMNQPGAFTAALAAIMFAWLGTGPTPTGGHGRLELDLRVPAPPQPVTVAGTTQLVYELHLSSFARRTITLTRIEVLEGGSRAVMLDLSGEALKGRITHTVIAPAVRAVLYLEVPATADEPPAVLLHRVGYETGDAGARESVVGEGGRVAVRDGPAPVLGPPLRGGPWTAVYDPSWERGHRRVFYVVDGRARIPARFAIDWFRVDGNGRTNRGDADRVSDYLGYGAEVLAVADGLVAATRTDATEPERLSAYRPPPAREASGNYVALALGNGLFAFYEHLKPGSIRVAPGERVRRGQVIGALGFTGQGTGPHLHFHVADGNSLLGAEGVPFVLERFELLGRYESLDGFGREPWLTAEPGVPRKRRAERPGPNSVVAFPDSL